MANGWSIFTNQEQGWLTIWANDVLGTPRTQGPIFESRDEFETFIAEAQDAADYAFANEEAIPAEAEEVEET